MSMRSPQPDHVLLIAGAAVNQAATPTAALAERLARERRTASLDTLGALVRVFAHADSQISAHIAGSFHPGVARGARRGSASTKMKSGFTVAF